MKNTMKNIALSVCLSLGFVVAANAQTATKPSGDVTFNVSTLNAVDIRSGGPGSISANAGSTAPTWNAANTGLSATLNVDNAAPDTNDGSDITASVKVRLRSNVNYKLTAAVNTPTTNQTGTGAFSSSDIKYGLDYDAGGRNGAAVNSGGTDSSSVTGTSSNFGVLSATPTDIASGSRISLGGHTQSSDNFVPATLNFKISKQFYTPGTFSQTLTVGILAVTPSN
jgi:hypothetical protein